MAEIERGYAMLITAGNPKLSQPLKEGIMAVRLPMAKPLEPHEAKTVSAEIERQKEFDPKAAAKQLRVAMHREPVDYATKIAEAEIQHGEPLCEPGPLARFGTKLLVGYAMVVLAFDRLFKSVGT